MRVSNEEKDRSRERILDAASRLFREKGVDGAGLGDIMRAAGMTHGGFYRHFKDKDALLVAALGTAFDRFAKPLQVASDENASCAVARFRARYLSSEHVKSPGEGCPVAALGPDIARMEPPVRAAFTAGIRQMVEALAREDHDHSRHMAMREIAQLIGAVILARAVDDDLAEIVLTACRQKADGLAG